MLERCVVWLGSGFRGLASALHPARVLLLLVLVPGGGSRTQPSRAWKRFLGTPANGSPASRYVYSVRRSAVSLAEG